MLNEENKLQNTQGDSLWIQIYMVYNYKSEGIINIKFRRLVTPRKKKMGWEVGPHWQLPGVYFS